MMTFVVSIILLFFCQINTAAGSHQAPLSLAPKDTSLRVKNDEDWRQWAVDELWKERERMAFTPLVKFEHIPSVLLLFKDESSLPHHKRYTESLKHRYSWALVLWALLEGHIRRNTVVYEASSGNTARSEAYMCSLLGVRYITVLPNTTERLKVNKIIAAGGEVEEIPPGNTLAHAEKMAKEDPNGFFINQFGNSAKALDYHESGNFHKRSANLFHELMAQMSQQKISNHEPTHFFFSAATGGTISSAARYVKKYGLKTEIVLADTQYSAYYDLLVSDRFKNGSEDPQPLWTAPGMAGTGLGWAGPIIQGKTSSLIPEVIDRALKIPDLASVAGMHILRDTYGISGGPSTGVNFAAAIKLIVSDMPKYAQKYAEDYGVGAEEQQEDGYGAQPNHSPKFDNQHSQVQKERNRTQNNYDGFLKHVGNLIRRTSNRRRSKKSKISPAENEHQAEQESGHPKVESGHPRPYKMVLATLIADNGENYVDSYYNPAWIEKNFAKHGGLEGLKCWRKLLEAYVANLVANNGVSTFQEDPIKRGVEICARYVTN